MIWNSDPAVWNVAVLAGGDSDEAPISLCSGAAVQRALSSRGHVVVHLDPSLVDLRGVDWRHFDAAFIALHGQFGEDGQVQELLQQAGIPYTGSDPAASRLAFSKSAAKERFLACGVPTPRYFLISTGDSLEQVSQLAERIGYPLVIKPDAQGSSLGVSIVRGPEELDTALLRCFEFDQRGLMEPFIAGTEWTVGLMNEEVLPPICIETTRGFFDYQAKYEDNETRYLFQTDWPESRIRHLKEVALATCRAIGTRGLVRVDFRADTALQPWVLEVNTIPGLTDHSLVPKAAAQAGIDFPELCERMVRDCYRQRPPRPHHLQNRILQRDLA